MPTQMDDVFAEKNKTPQCPVCERAIWEDGSQLKVPAHVYNPTSAPVVGGERIFTTVICQGCGYVMMFRR